MLARYLMRLRAALAQASLLHEVLLHYQGACAAHRICTRTVHIIVAYFKGCQILERVIAGHLTISGGVGPARRNDLPRPHGRHFLVVFLGRTA